MKPRHGRPNATYVIYDTDTTQVTFEDLILPANGTATLTYQIEVDHDPSMTTASVVNTVVFTPMPSARVTMIAAENQRWLRIMRKANLKSFMDVWV